MQDPGIVPEATSLTPSGVDLDSTIIATSRQREANPFQIIQIRSVLVEIFPQNVFPPSFIGVSFLNNLSNQWTHRYP